jgi:hypothetical protein
MSCPATATVTSLSAAESMMTSIATDRPAIAIRGGPTSTLSPPPASIRTATMPPGTLAPITERTAPAQSPVGPSSARTGPN